MGMDDRDGDYRSRGQPPRRRPYDGDDPPARSSSRDPREVDNPRSRPPRREYESGGDYDRSGRASRGGSSGRHERDNYDRRPRSPGGQRADRRSYDGGYESYDRPSRNDPGAS